MFKLAKSPAGFYFCRTTTFNGFLCGTTQLRPGLARNFANDTDRKSERSKELVNADTKAQEKLFKIISKSKTLSKLNKNPRFKHYFSRLSEAGVTSTITSFLILHEVTAIVPLFTIWWMLYQLDLPDQYELPLYFTNLLNQCGEAMEKLVGDNYSDGFDKNRLILSGAISYAAVKSLYPVRVLLSLWGAPYLGKCLLVPVHKLASVLKGKKDKGSSTN